jgi:heavy metal sensor kinase
MKGLHTLSPVGIRLQLTLWYSAIFTLLMLLSGLLFYSRFQAQLASSLDTSLQLQAQQVAGDITEDRGVIRLHDATADLPGFDPTDRGQHVPPADVNLGILVRILNAEGQPVRTTPDFRQLLVPQASISQPLHDIPWQGDVTTGNGQPVRLYSRALTQEGRIFGVVQVGTSLAQVQTTLHEVVTELLFLAPVILLLGALVSYWLAARAFLPIKRLIGTAREIKAGDLHQRVAVPRAQDEVRALALTLNEMIDHLERTFQRQRRFVADASHELRTPVTVIRSKTDMALLQIVPPQDYLGIFQAIHAEAERLGALISDLLALARADEGQVRLEQEEVQFDQLVQAVAATTEVLAVERQVSIHVQASEPVIVLGDEARLMQVVLNLLENALLYTHAGEEVFLSVSVQQTRAVLIVRDTGIGIAPEHLPHLFDRFYRVDAARTQTRGGNSGLGLSIVDWVIKAHGGSVAVESQVGKGSTFTVTLPLSRRAE